MTGLLDSHLQLLAGDAAVQSGDASKTPGKIVVCFHHLPTAELIQWTGNADKDYFGAFMGSEKLMESVKKIRCNQAEFQDILVFCAHIHRKREATVDGIPCATACLGQPWERDEPLGKHIQDTAIIIDV